MAFIAVALFALYPIFGKILLESVNPFLIIVFSHVLAAIILISILNLFKEIKILKKEAKHDFRLLILVSMLYGVLGPLFFFVGLSMTSAANSILIGRAEAIFLALLGVVMLKEKVTKKQVFGTIIMFTGIITIATKGFETGFTFNIGDIFIFIAAFSFASAAIILKKYLSHVRPEIMVTITNLFGGIILFIISLFFVDYSSVIDYINPSVVIPLIFLVVFTLIFAEYLWFKALEKTTA